MCPRAGGVTEKTIVAIILMRSNAAAKLVRRTFLCVGTANVFLIIGSKYPYVETKEMLE